MSSTLAIRELLPGDWCLYRDLRLAALSDSPDAFGGTLSAEQGRPPAMWQDRLQAARISGLDLPLVAHSNARPAGLVWAKVDGSQHGVINVFQMWVAAEHRGQGIGRALLGRIAGWARQEGARELQLGVACGDSPAMRLYLNTGFRPFGHTVPLRDGSTLQAQYMRLVLDEQAV